MTIREGSSGTLAGRIVDSQGAGVSSDVMLTMTFTLYDYVTGAIINGRDGVDILNNNGATVSNTPGSEGTFTIPLSALDNVILDATRQSETHVVFLRFTAPLVSGSGEIKLIVRNVRKIT